MDDYRKIFELALVLLLQTPDTWVKGDHWIRPGAFNNVRWMSAFLYAPMMYAFSEQMADQNEDFIEGLEQFMMFTYLIYVKNCA